jgi:hypothetical protein
MEDPSTTDQELLKEISALKKRIQELEQTGTERKRAEEDRERLILELKESDNKNCRILSRQVSKEIDDEKSNSHTAFGCFLLYLPCSLG